MKITLDKNYYASTDTKTLGYVGEVTSRKIIVENHQCEEAKIYKIRFEYPDGESYEVDITNGEYIIEPSILRRVGDVSIQISAGHYVDGKYDYLKKSNVLTLHICRSLNGEPAPVPTYEQSVEALEKVLEAEKTSAENASKAESASNAAHTAQEAAEQAKQTAVKLAANAEKAAENAAQSERTAQTAAATATDKAAEISKSAEQIQKNTDDISKLYSKSDGIVCNAEGSAIALNDSAELPFSGMKIFGRSTQDGTPSPDNPVPIVSVGDSGKIDVTVTDGEDISQSLTVYTPNGLPGITVTSDSNYTDQNGQQWICDEIDFERGVYVQRVHEHIFNGTENWKINGTEHKYFILMGSANGPEFGEYSKELIGLCEKAKIISYWDLDQGRGYGIAYIFFWRCNFAECDANNGATVDDFKSFLTENPMKIMYAGASIETPLTAEQIAAYKALHTNKLTTTIANSDNAHMTANYTADTKAYIDNKFNELATAIIATGGDT